MGGYIVQKPKLRKRSRHCKIVFFHIFALCLLWITGCGPTLSSPEETGEFEKAEPIASKVGINEQTGARAHTGSYRVVPGDILEFQMPTVLRVISADMGEWLRPAYDRKDIEPYLVRVNDTGAITLPIVGTLPVAGKTLAEVEALVISAYYPRYVVNPPAVVCKVTKYQGDSVSVFTVLGLVNQPNAFPYPPDVQYNLMEALAFARGLDMVADPRYVKIFRQDAGGKVVSATFSIDSKSLIKAYSVAIKPGDVIYVDHTLSTRTNKFLSDVFQLRVGADIRTYND